MRKFIAMFFIVIFILFHFHFLSFKSGFVKGIDNPNSLEVLNIKSMYYYNNPFSKTMTDQYYLIIETIDNNYILKCGSTGIDAMEALNATTSIAEHSFRIEYLEFSYFYIYLAALIVIAITPIRKQKSFYGS